nr:uncharacterized protein LOC123770118 [Procambarus clarkii]
MRLLVRCAVTWVMSLSLMYYFTTHTGDAVVSLVIFCFIVDELLRFYWMCYRADLLQQAVSGNKRRATRTTQAPHLTRNLSQSMRKSFRHLALEDTVWELYQRLDTSQRPLLAALASRLNSRRAVVSVGGLGVLGRRLLLSFVNLSCTYTAILYQYRPNILDVPDNTTLTSL